MSLLLANGHALAQSYPLSLVWEEADIIIERENHRMRSEAILTNQAVSAVISKKAETNFSKTIKDLGDI